MEECCVVCAEPLEWVGYGACGHRDVCSTCIARLRFVLNNKCCCICKQECTSVFMTKALGDFTKVIKNFEGLHDCGNFWYENNTQAFFDDKDHYTMIKAMCRLSCQICEQGEGFENSKGFVKKGYIFKSLDLLRQHISIAHKVQMCSLCLEGRKIFICEQKLYSKAQLEHHLATGDSEVDGIGEEKGGFSGHPMCNFCQRRYYGDNELYHHMSVDHYLCHICQRLHPGQYDYFHNYDDLEVHFRHEHSLCEHPDCLAKKFVVFTSDVELKRHNALTHGGNMSRSQRTAALQIPVSFQYRRPNIRGHASPSNITNYSNGHLSMGAHGHNQSNYTNLESGGSLSLQFGTGSHTDDMNVAESIDRAGESSLRSEHSSYLTSSGGSMQLRFEESAFPPLPGSRIAKRKTKQHNRGPVIPVDGGNESRGSSTSSSQSHLHGRTEDKSGSSSNKTVNLPNQWQQSSGREMWSEGKVNVVLTSNAVNRRNSPLVNEDSNHGTLPVSEPPLVSGFDKGFKLTDEVRLANKALSDCIRSRLGDDEKFLAFKDLSAQFRKGNLDPHLYCKHIKILGLWDLVPELARLCPDPERQRNLLHVYEEGSEGKQLGSKFNPLSGDELGNDAKKAEASEVMSVPSTMDAARRLMDRGGTSSENKDGGALSRDNSSSLKGKKKVDLSVSKLSSSLRSSSENGVQNKPGTILGNGSVSKLSSSLKSSSENGVYNNPGNVLGNGSVHKALPSQSNSSCVTKMWSCNVCTLENSDLDSECAACGTSGPLTSCPGVVAQWNGKRTKKISKFERLRLDHDAPLQLLQPAQTLEPAPPVQMREPAQKMRGGGVWKNGGGQRLVAMAQRETQRATAIEAAWRR